MWSFERDKELLAAKAVDEAVSIVMRFNSFMAVNSRTPGDKEDLQHTADFLTMCKVKINEEIDKKINVLEERSK